jgi:hypothetical protein
MYTATTEGLGKSQKARVIHFNAKSFDISPLVSRKIIRNGFVRVQRIQCKMETDFLSESDGLGFNIYVLQYLSVGRTVPLGHVPKMRYEVFVRCHKGPIDLTETSFYRKYQKK